MQTLQTREPPQSLALMEIRETAQASDQKLGARVEDANATELLLPRPEALRGHQRRAQGAQASAVCNE